MSQVQKFQFGLMDLRVIELEGQPWFVLGDVLETLGITRGGSNTAGLNPDEYKSLNKKCGISTSLFPGRTARVGLVAEAGLYKLVMRSTKPESRAFADWVTRVVLPAIRKDGAYVLGEEKVATGEMSDDELFLKALQVAQRKVDRYKAERDQLELDKQLLLPAAQVGDAIGQRKGLSVVEFARKLDGVNVNQVRNDLGAMQYLFRRHGNWAVYAKFRDTLFSEKAAPDGRSVIVALEKGQQLLVQLYHEGRLTMKAGCKPKRHLELAA